MHLASEFKKQIGLLILAALVVVPLAPALAQGPSVKQAGYHASGYANAVQAYRQGDYQQAVRLFKGIVAQNAPNTNAHYYLALSLDRLGQLPEAAGEYAYVTRHSREANIVAYAKERLSAIQSATKPAAFQRLPGGNMAMVAAGNRRAATAYTGSAAQIAVPLKNSKNALIVDALLTQGTSQTGGAFIIDTGATYTSISQEMAEQLNLDLSNCETVQITTANGRIEVPKVMLQSLNVNGLEAHNIEATVIPVRSGASFSGLLGLSFIRQFVVTIDPQANQLIFQKNQ